jgi:capsular polysaccharide biosynthesis protein
MASDLERRQEGEQFSVLDAANFPNAPSFPKPVLFISGGAAGGLALGLAFFVFLELQDNSLRHEKDVEALVQVPVLAMLPTIKASSNTNSTPSPSSLGVATRL